MKLLFSNHKQIKVYSRIEVKIFLHLQMQDLTNDESDLAVLVIEAAGHHGCDRVIDHGQHLHIHILYDGPYHHQ